MEIIATVFGIILLTFSFLCLLEKPWKTYKKDALICFIIALFIQIGWCVIFLDPITKTEEFISNQYQNISFQKPVKIIETTTTKKFSATFKKEIKVKIYFIEDN